jgi:hypothetical protein
MMVVLGTRLTFFNDEWYLLLQRPGLTADSILKPHNEHLAAIPVLVYKGLVALFGLDSQAPFRLVHAAVIVTLGVLVFLFVRERVGQLLALIAATLILFLGPAWEDLLWSFQLGFAGSLVTGIGALMAVERPGRRGDAAACALLICAILLSDLGLPFVIAAAVAALLRRRPAQLWIAAVPAAIFGAWWIAYGHEAKTGLTLGNVSRIPHYVLDGASAGLAALAGLTHAPGGGTDSLAYGRPLLVLAAVGLAWALLAGWRPTPFALVIATAAVSFWALAGANFIPGREPTASRYQLVNATLLIMFAAESFRGTRPRPTALAALVAVALVALGANLGAMGSGYRFLDDHARFSKAAAGTLEIMRGEPVPPSFQLVETVAHDPYVSGFTAERYFAESEAHGLPPYYTPAELASAPPEVQQAADNIFLAGYVVGLVPAPAQRRRPAGAPCKRLVPALGGQPGDLILPPGGATIINLGRAQMVIGLRRFAPPGLPTNLGTLAGRSSAIVRVPVDSLHRPWSVEASGGAPLEVCG